MKKRSTKFLGGVIAFAAIFSMSAGTALAYHGDPSVKGPNYTEERHEAMINAFDSEDYSVWAELMEGKGRIAEFITENNFADFVKVHNLMLDGDVDGATALRTELGLNGGFGQGLRDGSGLGQGRGQGFRGRGAGQMNRNFNSN